MKAIYPSLKFPGEVDPFKIILVLIVFSIFTKVGISNPLTTTGQ